MLVPCSKYMSLHDACEYEYSLIMFVVMRSMRCLYRLSVHNMCAWWYQLVTTAGIRLGMESLCYDRQRQSCWMHWQELGNSRWSTLDSYICLISFFNCCVCWRHRRSWPTAVCNLSCLQTSPQCFFSSMVPHCLVFIIYHFNFSCCQSLSWSHG